MGREIREHPICCLLLFCVSIESVFVLILKCLFTSCKYVCMCECVINTISLEGASQTAVPARPRALSCLHICLLLLSFSRVPPRRVITHQTNLPERNKVSRSLWGRERGERHRFPFQMTVMMALSLCFAVRVWKHSREIWPVVTFLALHSKRYRDLFVLQKYKLDTALQTKSYSLSWELKRRSMTKPKRAVAKSRMHSKLIRFYYKGIERKTGLPHLSMVWV